MKHCEELSSNHLLSIIAAYLKREQGSMEFMRTVMTLSLQKVEPYETDNKYIMQLLKRLDTDRDLQMNMSAVVNQLSQTIL